jgi:hypothetical protein
MSVAIAAMTGLIVKAAAMGVVVLACVYAARLAGNHYVRSNPGGSKERKEAVHSLALIAAVVVAAMFLIVIAVR